MTADQLAQLTDEEKRVKLSEFCGWKQDGKLITTPDGKHSFFAKGSPFPDYLNDLDAIALVEARLSDEQHGKFEELLYYKLCQRVCSATARQRADAILMILP